MPVQWDIPALSATPRVWPADEHASEFDGVRGIWYEGLPWQGRPTRIFAWLGLPQGARPDRKVPGVVLVHGGLGTAFDDWVRLWNSRGYAAIAMDTCGCTFKSYSPRSWAGPWPRHQYAGPEGWGGFDQLDQPIADQWMYHAVADVVLANSLLRSLPEVDAAGVGLSGVSWGGILTCIVAGVDDRFLFAAPVYGCGFLDSWVANKDVDAAEAQRRQRWGELWDPRHYLPQAAAPMLWVTGTNDFAFPLPSLQSSYRLTKGQNTLCVRVRMVHGHGGPSERVEELFAYADSLCRGGVDNRPLAAITGLGADGQQVWAQCQCQWPVRFAELNYTPDDCQWKDRRWLTVPATLDEKAMRATAALPGDAVAWYLNFTDQRGLVVSTEHRLRC